ncbi:uroporphyrinogen decarboxylase [Candidatus Moduliflexota bacterium]
MSTPLFIRACRGKAVPRTPVWIMRQAGRYQPSYRALRRRHSFMEMCKEPELSSRVTLRAVSDLGVDAAIIFSDILIPVEAMGVPVEFTEHRGPVLTKPVRNSRDVARLRVPDPSEAMPFTGEAIRITRENLDPAVALIGFCGAPWTLASYMVEGSGSKNYITIKTLMFQHPDVFRTLMDKITATVIEYFRFQVASGAQVVQLFDSWAGALSPVDYRRFAAPWSKKIIRALKKTGVPVIHFVHNGGGLLEIVKETEPDVVGLDWRTDIAVARKRLGWKTPVQGNLDPCALFLPEKELRSRTREVLRANGSKPGHIFNLGHGILPPTKVAAARAMVEEVHRFRLK